MAEAMSEAAPPSERDLARIVLRRSLGVRTGDNVTIETWSDTLRWATPFVAEARKAGAHPLLLYEDEGTYWDSVTNAKPTVLGTVGAHEWNALAKTNAYVFFFGPSEWPRYDDLPPRLAGRLLSYNPEWYRRAAKARLRGARMWIGRTSRRSAERFGVDLEAWRRELLKASLVAPETMRRTGSRIGRRLLTGRTLRIAHPNGTELQLRLKRYPVQLDDALVDAMDIRAGNNVAVIPGGVVGVSVDESFGEGTVVGNRTVYQRRGPADDGRWTFRGGRLVEYGYGRGGEHFETEYRKAPKGRDWPGYFSIGLNPDLSMSPQMEDQELGAVIVRVGGNRFSGGRNPCPFSSWLAVRGADVSVDGHPIATNGRLV